jgi:CheY-like chemotaxis protein
MGQRALVYETGSTTESHVYLLVEDEELIRTLAAEFMAETGFEVLEAPDADTAVRLLQTEAARIHASLPTPKFRFDGWLNAGAPHPPQLALDRLGGDLGVSRGGVRTIACRYPIFPETL